MNRVLHNSELGKAEHIFVFTNTIRANYVMWQLRTKIYMKKFRNSVFKI